MFKPSLLIVLLLCAFPSARPCLQCDRVVVYIHEDFLVSRGDLTVKDHKALQSIIDHGYVTFREASWPYHGVIDPTTLYRARTEYHSEFDRYWQDQRGDNIHLEMVMMLEKGKMMLQKHLEKFVKEGLCPNKCGLLYQTVMNCNTCKYEQRTCLPATPPQDCEGHRVEAEEGDQVVLDCFLPWHSLLSGHTEYHYSWRPGVQNVTSEDEFQGLVVTSDSNIVLNQLEVGEQGVYLCLLQDKNGTVFSRTHFTLTVSALPLSTPRPVLTLPSVPRPTDGAKLHPDTLIITLGLLSALSLAASLTLLITLGTIAMRQSLRKEKRRGGGEQEEERLELMTPAER